MPNLSSVSCGRHRAWRLAALVALVMAGALGGAAPEARAHAEPRATDPAPNETVGTGREEVSITFIGLDPAGPFEIRVVNASGRLVSTGEPTLADDDSTVTIDTEALDAGTYDVAWTVAAEDDDPSSGSFSFMVEDRAGNSYGVWLLWATVIGIPAFVFLRPKRKAGS